MEFQDTPIGQQWAANQAREHLRHDIAGGIIEAQVINYAAQRVLNDHQQHVAYVNSLPPQAAAAHAARTKSKLLTGAGALALGILLIVTFPNTWFGTLGFVLAAFGFFRSITAAR